MLSQGDKCPKCDGSFLLWVSGDILLCFACMKAFEGDLLTLKKYRKMTWNSYPDYYNRTYGEEK